MRAFWEPEVETLPRPQLESLQLERLRQQVERLWRTSAFFREKWAGVNLELRHLEDLSRFPLVTKAELRAEQQAHPP